MIFPDKTLNNIMIDLKSTVNSDISTDEGTLIDHSFRGAAAEFEQAYIELGVIDQNSYAKTADREHLILRAAERGMEPYPATNAIWKARFNPDIKVNTRFSAGNLTYICTEQIEPKIYQIMCEQKGTKGNIRQEELLPIEYISGFENGELIELLIPARDEEETEDFRERYLSSIKETQVCSGNRAYYKKVMQEIEGVGACKIYRVTETERRIQIYFLDHLHRVPSTTLVEEVQEIIDPKGQQGEGEGKAPIFHVVDIYPCKSETIEIVSSIIIENGYVWEELLPEIEQKVDQYFRELSKEWEKTESIIVRILRVNTAIADVDGIIDIQNTVLNGIAENIILGENAVPVRGAILCRQ